MERAATRWPSDIYQLEETEALLVAARYLMLSPPSQPVGEAQPRWDAQPSPFRAILGVDDAENKAGVLDVLQRYSGSGVSLETVASAIVNLIGLVREASSPQPADAAQRGSEPDRSAIAKIQKQYADYGWVPALSFDRM